VRTAGGGPVGPGPLGRHRRQVRGKFYRSSSGGGADLIRLKTRGSFELL
jgi:hypothetical protein